MGTPYRQTADGFELQMATNHLGHFALTGLLLDRLLTTERSRVVTVSSHMHRVGHLDFDDVAGATVAQHLGRTTARRSWPTCSSPPSSAGGSARQACRPWRVAAHPGWTRSNLSGSGAALATSRVRRKLGRAAGTTLGQSAAAGALPVLYAATSLAVALGAVHRAGQPFELVGPPRVVQPVAPGPRRGGGLGSGRSPRS